MGGGKKNEASASAPEPKVQSQEGEDGEEEEEPIVVETGDSLKVKQVMDEAVVRAALDCELEEDHKWGNVKLLLMAVACIFAAVAQFYPTPFPESRPLLAVCCVSYFLCSVALQLILSFVDADIIMRTLPGEGAPPLIIQTDFPRFQEEFTVWVGNSADVKFSWWGTVVTAGAGGDPRTSQVYKVGDYFDVEGNFFEEGFVESVMEVIKSHISKKTK